MQTTPSIWASEEEFGRIPKGKTEEIIVKKVSLPNGDIGIYLERYRTTPIWKGPVGGVYIPIEQFPNFLKLIKEVAQKLIAG